MYLHLGLILMYESYKAIKLERKLRKNYLEWKISPDMIFLQISSGTDYNFQIFWQWIGHAQSISIEKYLMLLFVILHMELELDQRKQRLLWTQQTNGFLKINKKTQMKLTLEFSQKKYITNIKKFTLICLKMQQNI